MTRFFHWSYWYIFVKIPISLNVIHLEISELSKCELVNIVQLIIVNRILWPHFKVYDFFSCSLFTFQLMELEFTEFWTWRIKENFNQFSFRLFSLRQDWGTVYELSVFVEWLKWDQIWSGNLNARIYYILSCSKQEDIMKSNCVALPVPTPKQNKNWPDHLHFIKKTNIMKLILNVWEVEEEILDIHKSVGGLINQSYNDKESYRV